MSFGFGIGDFLAVGNLAWTVYQSCKGLREEFQEISRELFTIHTVIKGLQDEAVNPQSFLNSQGVPRKQELLLLIKNLEESLKALEKIVVDHQAFAKREQKIWNRLKLAAEDLNKIHSKLTFHITAINAFTSSLNNGALVRIETVLLSLVEDVRQGRRQPSCASFHGENNESVWKDLESDLAGDGISSKDIAKHKPAIKAFVLNLLSDSDGDTASLIEVASVLEFGDDHTSVTSLSHGLSALSCRDSSVLSIIATAQESRFVSKCDEECTSGEGHKDINEEDEDTEQDYDTDEDYEDTDEEYGNTDEECENTYEYEIADEEIYPDDAAASRPAMPVECYRFSENPTESVMLNVALDYLDRMHVQFASEPEVYKQFIDILKGFKTYVLDTPGVIEWVSALFVRFPELLEKFNMFLPLGYEIQCGLVDNCFAFRVCLPRSSYIRIPDLQAMRSLALGRGQIHIGLLKWIDPASLNILQPYPTTATVQLVDVAEIAKSRASFLRRLKAFLDRLKTSKDIKAS